MDWQVCLIEMIVCLGPTCISQISRTLLVRYLQVSRLESNDDASFNSDPRDRWAASVVSTRQNNILNKSGDPQLSLIPLMDFLNHQYGNECIHFNGDREQIECTTMNEVKKDQQIFMFYGKRTNAEFLIHNGFVPRAPNPSDSYLLRLGTIHHGFDDLFNDMFFFCFSATENRRSLS